MMASIPNDVMSALRGPIVPKVYLANLDQPLMPVCATVGPLITLSGPRVCYYDFSFFSSLFLAYLQNKSQVGLVTNVN